MTELGAPSPAEDARPAGYVSGRVWDWLRSEPGADDVTVAVVHRSPLGALAVGVVVRNGDAGRLSARVAAAPWVTDVASSKGSVYLRIADGVLREWISEAFRPGPVEVDRSGAGQRMVVHVGESPGSRAGDLTHARMVRVATAIGGVLRARGYEVRPLGDSMARRLVITAEGGAAGADAVVVGAVDVRQGALLARHGGVLRAPDVVSEVRAHLMRRWGAVLGPDLDTFDWCETYAEALLAFLLLRDSPIAHVELGETQLFGQPAAAFDEVIANRAWAMTPDPAFTPAAHDASDVQALLMSLDLLPGAIQHAGSVLDLAPLVRFLTRLAERVRRVARALPPGDPARSAVGVAIDRVLDVLGITLPDPIDPRLFEKTTR